MTLLPPGVKVHLAFGYIDMRKGIDGLAMLVQGVPRQDPFSGHLFVFRGRKADLIKIVFWDGTGLCLFTKRLEHGVFLWPSNVDPGGTLMLNSAQLSMLIDGVDWRAPERQAGRIVGDDAAPRPRILRALSDALGVDPQDLAPLSTADADNFLAANGGEVIETEVSPKVGRKRTSISSIPAFNLEDMLGGEAWLQINQRLSWLTVIKILQVLKGEDAAAVNRRDGLLNNPPDQSDVRPRTAIQGPQG